MKIIKLIIEIILDLIGNKIKPVREKKTIVVNHNYIIHKNAVYESINFLNDNQEAYYRGNQKWTGGYYNGKYYNNISFYKKDGKFYAVKRHYNRGIYSYITSDIITEKQYKKRIGKKLLGYKYTYCNIAAAVFCKNFNMRYGNFAFYRIPLEEKPKQLSANKICKYLKAGKFNTSTYKFKQCVQDEAVLCASLGGFGFATLKKLVGSGHIAAFSGDTLNHSSVIFQAGKDFGKMFLHQGFGLSNMKKLKYWVMVKA